MKLYFARHGHTNANATSPVSQTYGEIDEPLNKQGIQQANDLTEQLKDVHFDVIVTSPFKRARQTAEIVNKYHNLPLEVDDEWRERGIGEYTNLKTWNNLFDFDQNFSLENSEDLKSFFKRIYTAIDAMKQEYYDETVLVVSHVGVYLALYAYVNKLPLSGKLRINLINNCEYRLFEI